MAIAQEPFLAAGWGWGFTDQGEAAGPPERPPAGFGGPGTPVVTRGVKHGSKVSGNAALYGPDWIRFTGPASMEAVIMRWASVRFGEEHTDQGGFSFYQRRRTWAGGAKVCTEHNSGDSVMVELGGDTLQLVAVDDRIQIIRELVALGLKCTRLDIAADIRSRNVGLCQAVLDACIEGHLTGAKTWKPFIEYGARGQIEVFGVSIGKRGSDGSGRYVRFYDKGLETGEAPMGRWERFEAEFCDDVANQLARALAVSENWREAAVSMLLGSVDFRVGSHRRARAERPRAEWWAAFLRGVEGMRVNRARRLASLATRARWFRTQVLLPLKGMAVASGKTVEEVFEHLTHGARIAAEAVDRAALSVPAVQYAQLCAKPAAFRGRRSFRLTGG